LPVVCVPEYVTPGKVSDPNEVVRALIQMFLHISG